MKQTFNNREYALTRMVTPELTMAELQKSGYDGHYYTGISLPVGKQRTTRRGLFIRTVDGQFKFAF